MNSVNLVGRLGQDPELRYTQNKTAVVNFSIATSSKVKDEIVTEWHKIVAWGTTAENVAKFVAKGRQVSVQGRLQTRPWEDKEGNKRETTEVVANMIGFLGDKEKTSGDRSQGSNGGHRPAQSQRPPAQDDRPQTPGLGDIPF